jgi:hypothetical protein
MGIRRAGIALVLLAAALSSGAGTAVAAPTTSGPLVGRSVACEGGAPSPGWFCSSWYELLPAETNATEDYSVYWVELGVEPSPGRCVRSVSFAAEFPSTARVVSVAPARDQRFRRPRAVTTELVVDAEGGAPVPGHIEEEACMGAGRTKVSWGPRRYSYSWTGRHAGRVYAVLGLEIAGDRIPPHVMSTWADGAGFEVGPCNVGRITSGR